MEPAVIDPQPAVFRGTEDVGVAVAESDVGMVPGFSRVDGLRRDHVIPGHHRDQRNAGRVEVLRIEPVKMG